MKAIKKPLSMVLTALMLLSMLAVGFAPAASATGTRPDVNDITGGYGNKYMFYMPDEWRNEHNLSYDGEDLGSCTPGIYWYEGSSDPEYYFITNGYQCSWPGYLMGETDPGDDGIFVGTGA